MPLNDEFTFGPLHGTEYGFYSDPFQGAPSHRQFCSAIMKLRNLSQNELHTELRHTLGAMRKHLPLRFVG